MNEKGYDAVGFALPENMFFHDIVHMDETDPFVQIYIDRLDTYTERSYSGTGVHSYGLMDTSKIPTYEKDGKKYTFVTLDKDSLKNDPDFKGPRGDKGDVGAQGPEGPQGPQGPKGADSRTGTGTGTGTTTVKGSDNIKVTPETKSAAEYTVALKEDISVNNVTVKNKITAKTVNTDTVNAKTVNAGEKVTVGDTVTIDKNGLIIKDGPSVTKDGINAGGKKVTGGQLFATNQQVVNNMSQIRLSVTKAMKVMLWEQLW